ncbi:hypothetical protein DFS34DRAFT_621293 [Phlyctochytrium arcticum]|nr:hypothetical protein DFS34DRAFT_621293 [Phlyctochytrium arcticum]
MLRWAAQAGGRSRCLATVSEATSSCWSRDRRRRLSSKLPIVDWSRSACQTRQRHVHSTSNSNSQAALQLDRPAYDQNGGSSSKSKVAKHASGSRTGGVKSGEGWTIIRQGGNEPVESTDARFPGPSSRRLPTSRSSPGSSSSASSIPSPSRKPAQSSTHSSSTSNPEHPDDDMDLSELFPNTSRLLLPRVKQPSAPNPQSLTHHRALARSVVQEKLVLMYASIQSGDISRAEITFERTWRTNTADMQELVEAPILNSFIQSHLSNPNGVNLDRAMDWYHKFDTLKIRRNAGTFVIMMQYFLQAGQVEQAKAIVGDMEAAGITSDDVLTHDRLSDKDQRAPIEALLREMGRDVDSSASADRLFLAALEEVGERGATGTFSEAPSGTSTSSLLKDMTMGEEKIQPTKPPVPVGIKSTHSMGIQVLSKALDDMQSVKDRHDKYDAQQWLEERTYLAAMEGFEEARKRLPDSVRLISQIPSDLVVTWDKALVPLIEREIAVIDQVTEDADQHDYGPILKLLSPEQLSRIVITEFLRPPQTIRGEKGVIGEANVIALATGIAHAIEIEHTAQQVKKYASKQKSVLKRTIHHLHTEGKLFHRTVRRAIHELAAKHLYVESEWVPQWPDATRVKVGTVLIQLMLKIARLRVHCPDPENPIEFTISEQRAFEHVIKNTKLTRFGVIRYHPALYELLAKVRVSVDPWLLPMLLPPRPWITWRAGGYLQHRSKMVRTHSHEAIAYLKAADKAHLLGGVTRALDVLGSIPWRVNEEVYSVAAQMWNKNEQAPSLPAQTTLPEIEKPSDMETNPEARRRYYFLERKREMALRENFSLRADANYKLEIAKAFVGETMYFPHNVDFRGRAYPMPAHLNHIGNDLCRGLLLFDEGKPLGVAGLRWLKIHVAALAGHDKASFADRELFAEQHMDQITDSATNPIGGKRWWLKAESPWQLLAACIELHKAMTSPDPTKYSSKLPVHQDGTCNGLQHYAALGGDEMGAQQVNLLPGDKPADVYSGVAARVQKLVDEDVGQGLEEAILMQKRINRKLVKQTVMTNTYGVTFIGARQQVRNRLREARTAYFEEHGKDCPKDQVLSDEQLEKCSLYITRQIFQSMGQIFEGARAIQVWLNVTAKLIAKSINKSDIRAEELEDSEQLRRMGLLPSSKKLQSQEILEAEIQAPSKTDTLLDMAMEDLESWNAELQSADTLPGVDSLGDSIFAADAAAAAQKPSSTSSKKPAPVTSVIWTNPLGLPIVQPYRNQKTRAVQTLLQTVTILDTTDSAPVNPMKQSTAFPPNFIHSLDAAHMMLSAIKCQQAGLAFASVHDSYWTHAADVDRMNHVLRNEFVTLHSGNLMETLRNEFIERYEGHKLSVEVTIPTDKLPEWKAYLQKKGRLTTKRVKRKIQAWSDLEIAELPARGNFDIGRVRESQYFFH